MKRFVYLAVAVAALAPSVTSASAPYTVYTRAWCKDSVHGRPQPGAGAYPWISSVFISQNSDDCWRFVREHEAGYPGHDAGCSYVTPQGNIS